MPLPRNGTRRAPNLPECQWRAQISNTRHWTDTLIKDEWHQASSETRVTHPTHQSSEFNEYNLILHLAGCRAPSCFSSLFSNRSHRTLSLLSGDAQQQTHFNRHVLTVLFYCFHCTDIHMNMLIKRTKLFSSRNIITRKYIS